MTNKKLSIWKIHIAGWGSDFVVADTIQQAMSKVEKKRKKLWAELDENGEREYEISSAEWVASSDY